MKKRIISLLTALSLLLCLFLSAMLCSCDEQEKKNPSDSSESTTAGGEKNPEPAALTPAEKLAAAFDNLKKAYAADIEKSQSSDFGKLMQAAGKNGSFRLNFDASSLLSTFEDMDMTLATDMKVFPNGALNLLLDLGIGKPLDVTLFLDADGIIASSAALLGEKAIKFGFEELTDLLGNAGDSGDDWEDGFDYDNYYYEYGEDGIYAYAYADGTWFDGENFIVDYVYLSDDEAVYAILNRSDVIATVPCETFESEDYVVDESYYYSYYDYWDHEGDILVFPADAEATFVSVTDYLAVYVDGGVIFFAINDYSDFIEYSEDEMEYATYLAASAPDELYAFDENALGCGNLADAPSYADDDDGMMYIYDEDYENGAEDIIPYGGIFDIDPELIRTFFALLKDNEEKDNSLLQNFADKADKIIEKNVSFSMTENTQVSVLGKTETADIVTVTISAEQAIQILTELRDAAKADTGLCTFLSQLLEESGSETTVDDLFAQIDDVISDLEPDTVSLVLSFAIRVSDQIPIQITFGTLDTAEGASSDPEIIMTFDLSTEYAFALTVSMDGMNMVVNSACKGIGTAEEQSDTTFTVTQETDEGSTTTSFHGVLTYNHETGLIQFSCETDQDGEKTNIAFTATVSSLTADALTITIDKLSLEKGDITLSVDPKGQIEILAQDNAPEAPADVTLYSELSDADMAQILLRVFTILPFEFISGDGYAM